MHIAGLNPRQSQFFSILYNGIDTYIYDIIIDIDFKCLSIVLHMFQLVVEGIIFTRYIFLFLLAGPAIKCLILSFFIFKYLFFGTRLVLLYTLKKSVIMANQIKKEAECPICLEILKKPIRILKCGHNLCEVCLHNLITSRQQNR